MKMRTNFVNLNILVVSAFQREMQRIQQSRDTYIFYSLRIRQQEVNEFVNRRPTVFGLVLAQLPMNLQSRYYVITP